MEKKEAKPKETKKKEAKPKETKKKETKPKEAKKKEPEVKEPEVKEPEVKEPSNENIIPPNNKINIQSSEMDEVLKILEKEKNVDDSIIVSDQVPDDVFVYIEENNLDKELCEKIITEFENDHRKLKGIFGGKLGSIDERVKDTLDLAFSSHIEENWKEIDSILFFSLRDAIARYYKKLVNYNIICDGELFDSGFQIQKYKKNKGKYIWHNDAMSTTQYNRLFAFIWYLNDVTDGGETYFLGGKVKPTTGKLLLFPTTWTYMHKGAVPISNDKYIITGWVSSPIMP
jgi:hypothetical protein